MIRIAVTVADAGMAANVGGPVQISLKTYDIECPEMESLLREGARGNTGYMQAFVSGVEILEPHDRDWYQENDPQSLIDSINAANAGNPRKP